MQLKQILEEAESIIELEQLSHEHLQSRGIKLNKNRAVVIIKELLTRYKKLLAQAETVK